MSASVPATVSPQSTPESAGALPDAALRRGMGGKFKPSRETPVGRGPVWLFSPTVDLAAFLGSAVIALALLALGWQWGLLNSETPEWTWISAVLLVDVAHVYATGFRVYFVPGEFSRRPWVYGLSPVLALALGMAVYSESETLFWRLLAYLAVFHFVRQQYGWVALYRSRAGETGRLGRWIDTAAIYLATVYPLVFWHAHLPRNFWWFLPGDFTALPRGLAATLQPIYWLALTAYCVRTVYNGIHFGFWNPGKDVVLVTTAVCWHVGIITVNSDYAFTVTNVIIHGVPYLVLVYWYRFVREPSAPRTNTPGDPALSTPQPRGGWLPIAKRVALFLGVVWMLAYAEELFWDRGIWHERGWLFGGSWELGSWRLLLVPLLAVPQITHYVLDGFIWRRRSNPELQTLTQVPDARVAPVPIAQS